ncbi:MAG: tetratricopeptide repeat protein [Geitlerinemataceae cyanobacterium]
MIAPLSPNSRCLKALVRRGAIAALLGGIVATPAIAEVDRPEANAQIAQLLPLESPNRFDRPTLMREANRLMRDGQYADAETIFRQLLDRNSRDAVLHYKLGRSLAEQYRDVEAEAAYREAIKLEDRYVLALHGLGELLSRQSRWLEAIVMFERAVDIEGNYTDAQLGLGQALWQLGRDREALDVLETALEQLVADEELWQAIAVAQLMQKIERTQDLV